MQFHKKHKILAGFKTISYLWTGFLNFDFVFTYFADIILSDFLLETVFFIFDLFPSHFVEKSFCDQGIQKNKKCVAQVSHFYIYCGT